MLPNFIIIGAQKSGTTSLFKYLVKHPFVFSPIKKEVNFFAINFERGISWYQSHFEPNQSLITQKLQPYFITGEATPDYLFHPHAPRRVKNTLPQVKLIILLRNPVDRAYSHYFHEVRFGRETLEFEEAIEQEQVRLKGELEKMLDNENYYSFNYQHHSYLSRGLYINQVNAWLNLFPPEQILILKSEELFANPPKTYKKILAFIGLPSYELKEYKSYNMNFYESMKPETKENLKNYFKQYNEKLYQYLGCSFNWN